MQANILHTARQILNVGAGSDEMPCGCHGESKNTMLRKSVLPNIIIGKLAQVKLFNGIRNHIATEREDAPSPTDASNI